MKAPSSPRSGFILKALAVLAALVVTVVVGLGVTVYQVLRVGGDMKSVRQEVFDGLNVRSSGRIEIGVPSLVPRLGRLAAPFVDLPEEARAALRSVRGGNVGIYQLSDAPSGRERARLVDRVTGLMEEREWCRTVLVTDGDDTVLVFTPASDDSHRRFAVFVLVLDGKELVLVEGRADLEPVFELARHRWEQEGRSLIALH